VPHTSRPLQGRASAGARLGAVECGGLSLAISFGGFPGAVVAVSAIMTGFLLSRKWLNYFTKVSLRTVCQAVGGRMSPTIFFSVSRRCRRWRGDVRV
jgi:hypothetical protein